MIMWPHTQFKNLMRSYAAQERISETAFKLLFDGTRVNTEETPAGLKMENGDVIDLVMEQMGD